MSSINAGSARRASARKKKNQTGCLIAFLCAPVVVFLFVAILASCNIENKMTEPSPKTVANEPYVVEPNDAKVIIVK